MRARWIIDATGRRGLIKNKLGLRDEVAHDCNAVWLRLSDMIWMDRLIEYEKPAPHESAVEDWKRRVSNGERWRSTNHLMGRGYWAWLIPLASGSDLRAPILVISGSAIILSESEIYGACEAPNLDNGGISRTNPTSTAFSRFCRFDEGKCFVFNKSWSEEQNSDE